MTTVPGKARQVRRCAAALLAASALAACGSSAGGGPDAHGPLPPAGEPALGLPLETAVAQLFAVGFPGAGPRPPLVAKLRRRPWGVVVLAPANAQAPLQARTLVKALRGAASPAPLVLAADPASFPGVQLAPQPSQTDAPTAFVDARAAARVLHADGVGAALAPEADLAAAAGPAENTGFSDDPQQATRLVEASTRGWRAGRVAPVVGHFPGQGGASQNPQEGAATVGLSLADLRSQDMRPFAAVAAEVPTMQVSNALYAAFDGVTPASLLPDAYRLLRSTGFAGCAMTGDLVAATAATGGSVGRAALDALQAGADLVYVPGDAANQDEAYDAVLAAARSGRLPRARLADAVAHVAALKRQWGA